jgi:hypothetical protein
VRFILFGLLGAAALGAAVQAADSLTPVRRELPPDRNAYTVWRNALPELRLNYGSKLYDAFTLACNLRTNMPEGEARRQLDTWLESKKAALARVSQGIALGQLELPPFSVEDISKADFSGLKQPVVEKVFIMNEQGTRFFRVCRDSCGKQLVDEQISAWDHVEADWAAIMNAEGNVGFRLRKINNSILRMGREFQEGYLDWIGLDYEVDPRTKTFRYEIEVLGA